MAAAAHPITSPPPLQPPPVNAATVPESALVPTLQKATLQIGIGPDSVIARLPVEVEIGVPVREFRVRNLLALEPGVIIASRSGPGEDLPLAAGNVQLAWTEFDVVDTTLAVRITRLA
jgi:flagellar motor switch/type III secretory pathway protein FliN